MNSSMSITLNLEEALFVRSAVSVALKKVSRDELDVFWPGADIANVLRQLDITIDVLFAGVGHERI